eukprot:3387609-Pyramimonas_sp.AAC.3
MNRMPQAQKCMSPTRLGGGNAGCYYMVILCWGDELKLVIGLLAARQGAGVIRQGAPPRRPLGSKHLVRYSRRRERGRDYCKIKPDRRPGLCPWVGERRAQHITSHASGGWQNHLEAS